MKFIKEEIKSIFEYLKETDKRIIIVLLSFLLLQIVSWYFTSRRFFRYYLYKLFSESRYLELYEYSFWFIGDFITYFILPVLIIKVLLKENISDFGLRIGNFRRGIKYIILTSIIMIPLIWFFSASETFARSYPMVSLTRDSWMIFFMFQILLFIFLIGWEFIFRGFLLFGLRPGLGYYAILIQAIPFVMLHNGKPLPEAIGSIPGAIILAIIALRTGSIYYCVITHAIIMFSIEFISTIRYRSGDYGIGLGSLINNITNLF
jgi:uncharacterized protein